MNETNKTLYELMVVIDGDMSESEADEQMELVKKNIKDAEGEITKEDIIGKRRLAYRIKNRKEGYYGVFVFEVEGVKIKELETLLRLDKHCLRFLITKTPKNYEYQSITEPERRVVKEEPVVFEEKKVRKERIKEEVVEEKEEIKEEVKEEVKEEIEEEHEEKKKKVAVKKKVQKEEETEEEEVEKKKETKKDDKKSDKERLEDLDKALASFIDDPSINV